MPARNQRREMTEGGERGAKLLGWARRRRAETGDEMMRYGHARTRQGVTLVRTSARTQLDVANMRVGGCKWTDGDAMKGQQVPLDVGETVRVVKEFGE